jgi:hypothetical protein
MEHVPNEWGRLVRLSLSDGGWQEIDRLYTAAGGMWVLNDSSSSGGMAGLAIDAARERHLATRYSPRRHSRARELLARFKDAGPIDEFRVAKVAGWELPWACRFGPRASTTAERLRAARDVMLERGLALPLFWLIDQPKQQ